MFRSNGVAFWAALTVVCPMSARLDDIWQSPPLSEYHDRAYFAPAHSNCKESAIKVILLSFAIISVALFPPNAWPGEHQSLQEIRQVAAQFLQGIVEKNSGTTRIQIDEIDSRLRLSACESAPVAFLPPGVNPRGNITVGVRCSGSKPWKLYVSARVRTYDDVVVLTRSLPRHAEITAADVHVVQRELTNTSSPPLTRVEEAIGKRLIRSVPADRPLTHNILKKPIVIRRGQRVTLLYKSPGLEVRGSGMALDDGGAGERISARPQGNPRTVTGIVLGPGIIGVNQN